MADYHRKGAFSTGAGKGGLLSKFQFWGTRRCGADVGDLKSTKSSTFHAKAEQAAVRDHVCRPVILGSDGKTRPVLLDFPRNHHKDGGAWANCSPKQVTPGDAYTDKTPAEFVDHGRSSATGFHGNKEATSGPALVTAGGWMRPSKAGWAMPPDAALEKATSPRYMDSVVAGSYDAANPSKNSPVAVIDSSEAAKKYGGRFTW